MPYLRSYQCCYLISSPHRCPLPLTIACCRDVRRVARTKVTHTRRRHIRMFTITIRGCEKRNYSKLQPLLATATPLWATTTDYQLLSQQLHKGYTPSTKYIKRVTCNRNGSVSNRATISTHNRHKQRCQKKQST